MPAMNASPRRSRSFRSPDNCFGSTWSLAFHLEGHHGTVLPFQDEVDSIVVTGAPVPGGHHIIHPR